MWKGVILLCCMCLSSFGKLLRNRRELSDSILHYEPLNYPQSILHDSHQRYRRSIDPDELLHLDFTAHGRVFALRLRQDSSLFHPEVELRGGSSFHIKNILQGHLANDSRSHVHGFIHDKIFEGRIHTGSGEEFHVESAKQYFASPEFHSVIFNVEDIVYPEQHLCGYKKGPAIDRHINATDPLRSDEARSDDHSQQSDQGDSAHNIVYDDIAHHLDANDAKVKWVPQEHKRVRRAFQASKSVCYLHIHADYTFVADEGSEERAMYVLTQHVKSVSHVYEVTDFKGGSTPQEITLKIKKMTLMPNDNTCEKYECNFRSPNIGVEQFLNLISEGNHDDFCLSYVFAHRDFSNGVLGLAWIGSAEGAAGGICEKYGLISSKYQSLNTGIVTNYNYGKKVAVKVTDITFAHEVGHNFGAQHDDVNSATCSPGDSGGGNYIMYPRATQGAYNHNYQFSQCSKNYIWPVLERKSASCFEESGKPICGNKVVEAGEECDCGYADDLSCENDPCCDPAVLNDKTKGCKYSTRALSLANKCSPSNGLCCSNVTCTPDVTRTCRAKSDCAQATKCSATSAVCPPKVAVANMTECADGKMVCINGECSGSVCLVQPLLKSECQCKAEAELCNICCQNGNDSSTCQALRKSDGTPRNLPTGAPCDNNAGYCDMLDKCRKVDAEGPLSRLKNWLFNPETFDTILDWMKKYWWACILIGLGAILLMGGFIAVCSVHTPSSNPNKPPARAVSLPRTLSRRNRQRPSAPPSNGRPSEHQPGYREDPLPGYNTAVREGRHEPPGFVDSVEMNRYHR